MRMWSVSPEKLCQQHLLGEHVEMHMFAGTIKKGISIDGYISNKLVNPKAITKRHDELAVEMLKRGLAHKSPLDFDSTYLPEKMIATRHSELELMKRCPDCKIRIDLNFKTY